MGIGKRELFQDYYPGELAGVVREWNRLHGAKEAVTEQVDTMTWLGDGGEVL